MKAAYGFQTPHDERAYHALIEVAEQAIAGFDDLLHHGEVARRHCGESRVSQVPVPRPACSKTRSQERWIGICHLLFIFVARKVYEETFGDLEFKPGESKKKVVMPLVAAGLLGNKGF